jgi:hypothetical protein
VKFIRTMDYMKWAHKRNEDILTEPKTKPVTDYIKHTKENWSHMNAMNAGRFPKAILRC